MEIEEILPRRSRLEVKRKIFEKMGEGSMHGIKLAHSFLQVFVNLGIKIELIGGIVFE